MRPVDGPAAPPPTENGQADREVLTLRKLVAVCRHLSSLAIQDAGIGAVTKLIAERMETTVAVVDEKLDVLAAAAAAGAPDAAAASIRERIAHPRLAQVLGIAGRTRHALRFPDVDETVALIIAPILVGDEVPAYLLTIDEGEQATSDDVRLLLTEHAATICGVILGRERVVAAAATQVRYDLVEGLLSGRGSEPEDMLRWARYLGYDENADHRVLSLVCQGSDDLSVRVCAAVEQYFTNQARDAIIAVRGREVAVVLPEPDAEARRAEKVAHGCLERMRTLFGNAVVTAGIGRVCRPPGDISRSYDEARRTLDVIVRMGRTGTASTFDDLGIHRLLLQVADTAQLREFAREVFGCRNTRTRGSMAEYLSTLGCYFRANNSLQRASQSLHVHPNTVTYRIRRVEEIANLDFGRYRDRLMAQVALEILDAIGETP